jgi:signal peptidase I
MSDVPLEAEVRPQSPWLSVWWAPRESIERIVAGPPNHLVLLLAALGGAASAVNLLCGYGVGTGLLDGRALLGCLIGGGGLAVVNLYIVAFVISWLGRRVGGNASAAAVRAAFAWSMLPMILWLVLALLAAGVLRSVAIVVPGSVPRLLYLLGSACSIWSMIMTLLMLGRVERFGFWRTVLIYALSALALPGFVALVIRTFLFQPFNIPSGSNSPTLLVGDYVFATKYAYGYSRYSLPFALPEFSGRVFAVEPARGDVVVFRLKDGNTDYVKRLIGLPGDRVQMKSGQLYINDTPVARERVDDFVGDVCGDGAGSVKRWRETLPNGASYETLDCVDNGFYDNTNIYTVPAGHYFMLGDNRDNSTDSRVLSAVGYIPLENLIGRFGMIFFSNAAVSGAPPSIRYERIGTTVR